MVKNFFFPAPSAPDHVSFLASVGAYGANMAVRRLRRRLRSLFDHFWSKRKWSKKWSKNTIFKMVEFDQKWSKKKGMGCMGC